MAEASSLSNEREGELEDFEDLIQRGRSVQRCPKPEEVTTTTICAQGGQPLARARFMECDSRMHKSRLQELCHKRMWGFPAYTSNREGPDHNPLFGASVVVNGQTFDAPNLSKSLKEAHNKAAEVAFEHFSAIPHSSTSASPAPVHSAGDAPPPATMSSCNGQLGSWSDSRMYKSRLQELCHKQMWALPAYASSREGPDHNPLFGATVVINGQAFNAPNLYNSLKEAQNKAAEVALEHLLAIPSTASLASPAPTHLTCDAPPPATMAQIAYKSQLQQYVQKRNLGVPKYISVHEGSAHAFRFKAKVTVDGQTFESSQYFSTLREAEHSAARVALMSLPHEENHQDEPKFYKIILHQLVQKEGLSLPIYNTLCDGESHMPKFRSTVLLDGESFVGDVARTKKQAEMNAAKVALNFIKGRINAHSIKVTCGEAIDNLEQPKIHTVQPSSLKTEERSQTAEGSQACLTKVIQPATGLSLKYQVKHDDSPISFRNQLVGVTVIDQPYLNSIPASSLKTKVDHQAESDTNAFEQRKKLSVPISNVKIKEEKQANGIVEDERVVQNKAYREGPTNVTMIINEPDDGNLSFAYTDKLDFSNLKLDSSESSAKNTTAVNNPHNGQNLNNHHDEMFSSGDVDQLSLSLSKLNFDGKTKQEESKDVSSHDIDTEAIKDIIADAHKGVDSPFLLCNRVSVYPRKPDVVLPVGAALIPFNDGAWVAVSLDFSEHEDNLTNIL